MLVRIENCLSLKHHSLHHVIASRAVKGKCGGASYELASSFLLAMTRNACLINNNSK
jgi:hypothetical protein